MYAIISIISYLVRQFFLPNPFQNIFPNLADAEFANNIFGGVFILFAFVLTRILYTSLVDEKWIACTLFLVHYCILTGILLLISEFISNICWIVGIFLGIYIILCVVECCIRNRIN